MCAYVCWHVCMYVACLGYRADVNLCEHVFQKCVCVLSLGVYVCVQLYLGDCIRVS